MYRYQCSQCGRHSERIRIIKVDKKRKKWYILTCPDCGKESDVEEYKKSNHYSSPSYFDPFAGESVDEDSRKVDDSEGLSGGEG